MNNNRCALAVLNCFIWIWIRCFGGSCRWTCVLATHSATCRCRFKHDYKRKNIFRYCARGPQDHNCIFAARCSPLATICIQGNGHKRCHLQKSTLYLPLGVCAEDTNVIAWMGMEQQSATDKVYLQENDKWVENACNDSANASSIIIDGNKSLNNLFYGRESREYDFISSYRPLMAEHEWKRRNKDKNTWSIRNAFVQRNEMCFG